MSIKSLISLLLCLLAAKLTAQQDFRSEIKFLDHLGGLGQYQEAIRYSDQIFTRYQKQQQRDTLHFLKGRFSYEQKDIPTSINSFEQVSSASKDIWEISQFFVAFQQAYSGQYENAISTLSAISFADPVYQELQDFQLSAVHLLRRDFSAFNELSDRFSYEYYQLADYERDMIGISEELRAHNQKSPFVAGLLSALVPGAGRYYQGKIGQGTLALVGNGIFALQAYEGWRKDGSKSARFIIFGGLFSVFYVANIWGSVVSVRVNEVRFNENVDEAIFINMHLPVRLLFR